MRDASSVVLKSILGIETSCDETSAAVVQDGRILSNAVSSQINLHTAYGGVVPEIASRQHLKIVDAVIVEAICRAEINPQTLDAIAVTRGPGLPSALLVGVSAARGLALYLKKPLFPIHHIEAHLYSMSPHHSPFIALVVSGGHTMLIHTLQFGSHHLLGQTRDDAAGEAFDKAAQFLGLGYPGGPLIEQNARHGNPQAYHFPRPMLESGDWNFSFSGLKTALRYTIASICNPKKIAHPKILTQNLSSQLPTQTIADLCASFQAAVVDVLVEKTVRAAKKHGVPLITVSGGVACNRRLREEFQQRCSAEGIQFILAERALCTDNAGMIALLAEQKLKHGHTIPDVWDIEPDWKLPSL